MLPYLLLFSIPLFLLFLDKTNAKPNYFWYYVLMVVTSIFSGLRDMIGGYDIFIYGQVYEATIDKILRYNTFEIGYRYYYIFLKNFNQDRQFMFFITTCLISILHFRALKKYSPLLFFSLFILFCKFYLMSFVYLRQFIAMGIIWYAIPYILEKKFLKIAFLVLAAALFHKTSLIFAPLIFISTTKFDNFKLFAIIFIVLIIGLTPLSQFIVDIASESIDNSKVSAYAASNRSINIFYLLEIVALTAGLLNFKVQFYNTKLGTLTLNAVFLYILINTLSLINANFIRFGWYFYIFIILFLCNIYQFLIEQKSKNLYKFLIVLYFSATFFRLLFMWDMGDMMPYKTIYQDFNRPHLYDSFEYRPRKY